MERSHAMGALVGSMLLAAGDRLVSFGRIHSGGVGRGRRGVRGADTRAVPRSSLAAATSSEQVLAVVRSEIPTCQESAGRKRSPALLRRRHPLARQARSFR
jgi:hypothetical protein